MPCARDINVGKQTGQTDRQTRDTRLLLYRIPPLDATSVIMTIPR